MSLQVWLPLNGNLNNQGLNDVIVTNNGVTVDNNGKIGKCYRFDGNVYLNLSKGMDTTKDYSICYWFKEFENNTLGQFRVVYQCGNLIVGQYGKYLNIYDASGSGFDVMAAIDTTAWHHACFTFQSSKNLVTIYIDGEYATSKTVTSVPASNSYALMGKMSSGTYLFQGNLNDFRIYDHCLSLKEVKEISKGLVLHYPLNNIYNCQPNKYSSPYCDGYMSSTGGFTCTALTNERGYNYKMTYTGNGNNAWKSLCVPNYSFTVGKTYYYSVKIRCNKWTGDSLTLRASRSNNDWVTRAVTVCSTSLADGKWHEYYTYQTVNKTYDRSGSTVTSNPVLEFYTGSCATSNFVYDFDFDIKDVQVVESNEYMPFQQGEWNTNIVSDCSGFNNNGTKSGTLIYNSNSPRYSSSYKFNTGVDYIKSAFTLSMSELSCSFWVKPNSSNGGYSIIASNYNNPPSGFWLAINTEGSGVWFYNGTYVQGASLLTNDVWHHCVFTFKNGIGTWYVNGTSVISTDISSRGKSLSINNLTVGNSYTGTSWNTKNYGYISDFRFYATALSAADIKELYNSPVSIDKSGNMYAYEYQEV